MRYFLSILLVIILGSVSVFAQVPSRTPPLGLLNLQQPVNPFHPQARGLQNWWRVLPGRFGGSIWYDLMNQGNGTLTNMTVVDTSGWGNTSRFGGNGEMRFDGTDDRVVPPCGCIANLTAFTIMGWIKSSQSSTTQYLYQEQNDSTIAQVAFGFNEDFSGDLTAFNLDDASAAWTTQVTGLNPTDGQWHHVAVVQSSKSAAAMYFDGIQVATASATIGTVTTQGRSIGSRRDGTAPFNGSIDDVRVYTRALAADEIVAVYRDAQQGEPTLLTRLFPVTLRPDSRSSFMPFFRLDGTRQ